MKKILSIFLLSLVFVAAGFAQTTIYFDDFESYTVGSDISESAFWSTWSGNTGGSDDAQVTDVYNNTVSGANSLEIQADNDIVGFFGDLTAGEYEVNFYYYVESGDGGYFNIEHSFGSEWAFSVNFDDGGTGTLNFMGGTDAITYPQDTWFPVTMSIDINSDEIVLDINSGEYTNTWQFSTVEGGGDGLNVLDCINFYGAANSGIANYYVDDFEFIEIVGYEPADISLNVTEIISTGDPETVIISNAGQEGLDFEVYPYYPVGAKEYQTSEVVTTTEKVVLSSYESSQSDIVIPYKPNNSKDEILTHLTGDCTQALGWGTEVTAHGVALFDHNLIADYIGMEVSNVIIYTQDLPINTSSVEVWEGFDLTFGGPVDLITTEDFTPMESGQASVDLSNPAVVNGKDLWVGWTFTDPGTDVYCLAMDAGPPAEGVNYTKTGAAWGVITDPGYGNFGIVATLTGTAIENWVNVDVSEGTVDGGSTQDIVVSFDPTGLIGGNVYNATLVFESNDNDESWIEIPITYTAPFSYTTTFTVDDGTNPIEGATVSIDGNDLTTDVSGVASIDLIDGTYAYTVDFGTCDTYNGSVTVDGAAENVSVSMTCPSSIEENYLQSINVYPNPSEGSFNIDVNASFELEVIDITGKLILSKEINKSTKIDINDKGIFFLKFTNNESSKTIKVVVE